MIKLPSKLKALYEPLEAQRNNMASIPGKLYHREREQQFYWLNNVNYKDHKVHLVGCFEQWDEVCKETGNIIKMCSHHTWISSLCPFG